MLDKGKSENIMPDKTRQDKTRQDKTRQDPCNRFSESDKGLSGQSESLFKRRSLSGNKGNGLQRPTQDSDRQIVCCKLNKMPEGKLTSMENATICDFNTPTASTVTSRYLKGLGGHKDNMVLEIWRKQ